MTQSKHKKEEKLAIETIFFNNKIESMQKELDRKSKQIFKLELYIKAKTILM